MTTTPVLHDFRILSPRHSSSQETAFEWLAQAHARADGARGGARGGAAEVERFRKILRRVGCPAEQIGERGHELGDFLHHDWPRMEIFRLDGSHPGGLGTEARTLAFGERARAALGRLYAEQGEAPGDLVHVTCTGYLSPSPAQRLVIDKEWGSLTEVTHCYHMGCYAAFPALRIARGLLAAAREPKRVDIAHTELCTLHLDPADHSLESFVIQTLFADGYALYSMSPALPPGSGSGLEVVALRERLLRGTTEAMTWLTGDAGMKMTLSKDVPRLIAGALEDFLRELGAGQGLSLGQLREQALFAIHPGGPKILDYVEQALALAPRQLEASRAVLRRHGNMSSATIPHIWQRLADDREIPAGAWIVSLAFGPGLTLCGGLLRKVVSGA